MIELPDLYPHQKQMRDDIRTALAKNRRAILCAPPGTGKTRLAKWVMGAYANRDKREDESGRAMLAVHRRGLVDNASNSFAEHPALIHGLIMAGRNTSTHNIQVASAALVASLYKSNQGDDQIRVPSPEIVPRADHLPLRLVTRGLADVDAFLDGVRNTVHVALQQMNWESGE